MASSMASASSAARLSPQPDTVTCMRAPPISSSVTFSPTTISAIRGEPRYIEALPSTMKTTSQNDGIGAASGARAEQAADLRHLAGQGDLVVEDPPGTPPAREEVDLVGDPRTGAVDEPEHRQLVLEARPR